MFTIVIMAGCMLLLGYLLSETDFLKDLMETLDELM